MDREDLPNVRWLVHQLTDLLDGEVDHLDGIVRWNSLRKGRALFSLEVEPAMRMDVSDTREQCV